MSHFLDKFKREVRENSAPLPQKSSTAEVVRDGPGLLMQRVILIEALLKSNYSSSVKTMVQGGPKSVQVV